MTGVEFPLLGLPQWPGPRGPRISSRADGVLRAVVHSYGQSGGRRVPALVIAQTIPGSGPEPSPATLRNLLLAQDRPSQPEEASRAQETVTITGTACACTRIRWSDPRIDDVGFTWRGYQVRVSSWEHPLGDAFFASLGVL